MYVSLCVYVCVLQELDTRGVACADADAGPQTSLGKLVSKKTEGEAKEAKSEQEKDKENEAGIMCSLQNREGCEMCSS
jgi:hypothetical protein